jgi:outer membrane lipoprotein-sorting protein
MFKKIIYSFAALLFSFQFSVAQKPVGHAEQILSELISNTKTTAIKTNFRLIVSERTNPEKYISSGAITLKGNKFFLETNEIKAWFNGKTQWAYSPQSNEVSITEPTEKEWAQTNPIAILASFKTKSIIRFSDKAKLSQNYVIELIPKPRNKVVEQIEVQVNKSTGNLVSLKLINKNGSVTSVTLSNFQKGISVNDNIFVYNPEKHKGVVINDLR